jgi:hypothetical protein
MKIKGFIIENDLTLYDGGFANGYVIIPKDHPLWGLDYTAEEIESLKQYLVKKEQINIPTEAKEVIIQA